MQVFMVFTTPVAKDGKLLWQNNAQGGTGDTQRIVIHSTLYKYTPLQNPSLLIDSIVLKLLDTNTLVSRTEELLETTIQETARSVVSARSTQFTTVNHIYCP
jgi:hypothetical protein